MSDMKHHCDDGHEYIEYDCDKCPLCEALKELEDVQQTLNGYVDAITERCKRASD